MKKSWHLFANPKVFLAFSKRWKPVFGILGLVFIIISLYWGLFVAPADYQQGEYVRIMYIHVPFAWLGMAGYAAMSMCCASFLIWKHPLALLSAKAIAPIGAVFTALCLITGMIWGKPTWGTWWVWDARLTSMLLLLFLYFGFMLLEASFENTEKGGKAAAILALVGVANLPVIKFSVNWWNTLHQPASIMRFAKPAIDPSMLYPLLCAALGFTLLFIFLTLLRTETELFKVKQQRQQP
jgi:heme exporter protein C